MKAKIKKQLVCFPYSSYPPDDMNHTTVWIDQKVVWPNEEIGRKLLPLLKASFFGVMRIKIPSGTLEGTIVAVWDTGACVAVTLTDATWTGRAGGYIEGLSGLPWWEVSDGTVVDSQILPAGETMPITMYLELRNLAKLKEEEDKKYMNPSERLEFYKAAYAALTDIIKNYKTSSQEELNDPSHSSTV